MIKSLDTKVTNHFHQFKTNLIDVVQARFACLKEEANSFEADVFAWYKSSIVLFLQLLFACIYLGFLFLFATVFPIETQTPVASPTHHTEVALLRLDVEALRHLLAESREELIAYRLQLDHSKLTAFRLSNTIARLSGGVGRRPDQSDEEALHLGNTVARLVE